MFQLLLGFYCGAISGIRDHYPTPNVPPLRALWSMVFGVPSRAVGGVLDIGNRSGPYSN